MRYSVMQPVLDSHFANCSSVVRTCSTTVSVSDVQSHFADAAQSCINRIRNALCIRHCNSSCINRVAKVKSFSSYGS
jgi:uncharacterized membrane-anchored protein YhcB (DUF1043 family)